MAIAYRASGSVVTSSAGSNITALPAGVAADDILILVHLSENDSAMTAPSGWVEIPNTRQGIGTTNTATAIGMVCYWRRASATEPNWVNPVLASGGWQSTQMHAFSGCETLGDPFDVTAGSSAASSTSVSMPSVTTTVANCMILNLVANTTDTATTQTSAQTNANLSSLTERVDVNWTTGNGGGYCLTTGVKATAGATGATTATLATASAQAVCTISLIPAGTLSAPTGFPEVASRTDKGEGSNSTSHTIDLPATVNAGDVLLIPISSDGFPTITWDNSTAGAWTTVTALDAASTTKVFLFYKTADGTEGGKTLSFTTSASEMLNSSVFRITGASGNVETTSDSSTGDRYPLNHISLTPSWGSKKTLWLALLSKDVSGETIYGSPPNYTAGSTDNTAGTSGNSPLVWAYSPHEVATEAFPGFVQINIQEWAGYFIAVEPTTITGPVDPLPSDSVTVTDTLFADLVTLADSVTPSETLTKAISVGFADSVTPSEALANTPKPAFADSVTASDSVGGFVVGKGVSETVTVSEALTQALSRDIADSATPAEALVNTVSKPLADSATPSDDLGSETSSGGTLSLSDSVTVSDSGQTTDYLEDVSDSVTVTEAKVFSVGQSSADGVAGSDGSTLATTKALADSAAASDSTPTVQVGQALTESVTPSEAMVNNTSKVLSDSVTASEDLATSGTGTFNPADSVAVTDALVVAFSQLQADSATLSETLVNSVGKPLADSATPADAQTRDIGQTLTDSVAPSEASAKATAQQLADSASLGETLTSTLELSFADDVTPDDDDAKALSRAVADTATLSDGVITDNHGVEAYVRNFSDSVTLIDDQARLWRSEGARASVDLSRAIWVPPQIVRPSILARIQEGRGQSQAVLDNVTIGDTANIFKDRTEAIESFGLTDVIAKLMTRSVADSVSAADTLFDAFLFPPKPNDPVTLTDAMAFNLSKALADSATLSETMARQPAKILADSVTMSDTAGTPATFVAAQSVDNETAGSTSTFATALASASAGDLAIVHTNSSVSSTPPVGWTEAVEYIGVSYGYYNSVYYKVLTTGDISSPGVFNSISYSSHMVIYRGATSLVYKTVDENVGGTVNAPGFVKSSSSKGVFATCVDRDPGATVSIAAGFTARISSAAATHFTTTAGETISYVNNAIITFTQGTGLAAILLTFDMI
jgi:hypothetical protein